MNNHSSYPTANVGIAQGKLEIFPTRKGWDITVGEVDLMWLLSQYDGKDVLITIQEPHTASTESSIEATEIEGRPGVYRFHSSPTSTIKEKME